MEEHPEVGIAKGKQSLVPAGNILSILEAYSRAASRMIDYQTEEARLKTLGTGGAIYRIKAITQAGGFDENLRRYGEDWDIEIRVRESGWRLCAVDASFLDYERHGLTSSDLWRRYWLRGYFGHYFYHKNGGLLKHVRMSPFAAFVAGLLQSIKLFRLTKKEFVFLLPFEHIFKTSAWYLGFINSHLDSYEPCS